MESYSQRKIALQTLRDQELHKKKMRLLDLQIEEKERQKNSGKELLIFIYYTYYLPRQYSNILKSSVYIHVSKPTYHKIELRTIRPVFPRGVGGSPNCKQFKFLFHC